MIFECENISIDMRGANPDKKELRLASIKGVMMFWWRAIYGENSTYENFGTMEKKSSFSIKISRYEGYTAVGYGYFN